MGLCGPIGQAINRFLRAEGTCEGMMGVEAIKGAISVGKRRASTLIPSPRHGAIAKNVAVLGFGTAFSQFLNIIITPVLSWYYSPESFGVMAASLSIVYIVASLSNANYDAAIVMPKHRAESASLLFLCLTMNFFSSVLFFLIACLVTSHLERFAPYSSLWLLAMLSMGVLLTSSFNCLQYYAVRVEDYAASSASHIMKTLCCIIVQLVGVLFSSSANWLIAGRVFGLAPAIAYLMRRDQRSSSRRRDGAQRSSLIGVAKSYRRFPLFAAPQRVIALFAEEMPTLVLASVFGPGAAGYYWFSSRLLQMPCGVISQAIGRVFSREAIKRIHRGQSTFRPALMIVLGLALIALPPVLVIIHWAPELFALVLDSQWQSAAVYCQWIVIWTFFRFSIAPILCLFTVLSEQKRLLKLDSVVFVLRALLIAYCALELDALALVIALSLFESAKVALYGGIILLVARKSGAHGGADLPQDPSAEPVA